MCVMPNFSKDDFLAFQILGLGGFNACPPPPLDLRHGYYMT